MKNLFTQSSHILLATRKTNARGVRGFNFRAAGFCCALLTLGLFGGIGVAQGQQPDPLTITNTGNVGIGTAAPANKLSVAGDVDVSGKVGVGTTKPVSRFHIHGDYNNTGVGGFALDATDINNPEQYILRINPFALGNSMVGYQFQTKSTVGGTQVPLTFDNQGNVGIGTTAPRAKFHVAGNGLFEGNVGIGTTSPARALDIRSNNSSAGMLRVSNTTDGGGEASIGFFTLADQLSNKGWVAGVGGWGNTGNFVIGNNSSDSAFGGVKLLIDQTGNVGIGTSSPGKGKLEISGTASGNKPGFSFLKWLNHPNGVQTGGSPNESLSIYASGAIGASAVFVFSDERIKNIRGRSDGGRDLETLLGIEITDYEYDDVIGNGKASHKKVIGQQVEKVFPEAVTRSTDVVPDIYQKATIKDGWVMLATTLKKGDRVRLIGRNQEGLHEVLEIANGKFRTAFAPEGDQVFVYGREVKDFRSVDYDAISMLNVSATQQLKKEKDTEVKALQEENAALRSQLAEQEKRLAAIEALLLSADKPAARTASLKKVN